MLERIDFYHVQIPFKMGYDHAQASRMKSDSLIVKLCFSDGVSYYGECAPRDYVTGESVETVISAIEKRKELLKDVSRSVESVKELTESWGDSDLSALCAAEFALLQWAAGEHAVHEVLGVDANDLIYSATLTGGSRQTFEQMAYGFFKNGMRDVKLKLVEDNVENLSRIDFVRSLYQGEVDIRIDGNEIWNFDENKEDVSALIEAGITEFEQPFAKDDLVSCLAFMATFGDQAKLIIDDGIQSWNSYEMYKTNGALHGVNLKISKHGGYFKSLRIAQDAINSGLQVQLGAHVGETSLLAYEGAMLGMKLQGTLHHIEGAFSTHLLAYDPVTPHVQFGVGGKLNTLASQLSVELPSDLHPLHHISINE